jgi:hypothetical protein
MSGGHAGLQADSLRATDAMVCVKTHGVGLKREQHLYVGVADC